MSTAEMRRGKSALESGRCPGKKQVQAWKSPWTGGRGQREDWPLREREPEVIDTEWARPAGPQPETLKSRKCQGPEVGTLSSQRPVSRSWVSWGVSGSVENVV